MTSFGFSVKAIPVAKQQRQKRADFMAAWEAEQYVVEAKFRKPHEDWIALDREAMATGAAERVRFYDRTVLGTLSGKIRDGCKQLLNTPSESNAFHILWFRPLLEDVTFAVGCLRRQLLGVRQVFVYYREFFDSIGVPNIGSASQEPPLLNCYHFDNNDFERHPALDACVISTHEQRTLCVNHFSPKSDLLRHGHLYAAFQEHGQVVDPTLEERAGAALMVDRDFSGKRDRGTLLSYLKDRYDILAQPIEETRFQMIRYVSHLTSDGAQINDESSPKSAG